MKINECFTWKKQVSIDKFLVVGHKKVKRRISRKHKELFVVEAARLLTISAERMLRLYEMVD